MSVEFQKKLVKSAEALKWFEQGFQLALHPNTVEEAAWNFNKAIEIEPDFMLAYFELGRMYYVWSHFQSAVEPLKKAISLEPSFPAYLNLGMNCNRGSMFGEAENALRKALEIDPESATANYELGFTLMITSFHDEKRMDEAIAHFRISLKIQPEHKLSAYFIGQILVLHLHNFHEALTFADEISHKFPDTAQHIRFLVDLNKPRFRNTMNFFKLIIF